MIKAGNTDKYTSANLINLLIYKLCSFIGNVRVYVPVTVAERSEAYTVFARSEAGIVVSNPTQGMDV
jgi:hypothetical protein